MAALDSTGFLGADDRQQIIARERELRSSFAASDPSSSGFITKFDFRKALYVDGGLSYESVSTVLEDTPQSAGRVAYNLWFEAVLADQYPLRVMLKSERREEEAFNANMQQAIATSSELLYRAFSQVDIDDTGHINLVDFQRCVMSQVGLSNNDADVLFQSVEDLQGAGFVNYIAWLRSVQNAANAESLPADARSALSCSPFPAMAIDRFWIAQNPALVPVKMALQPLARQAVSRTVALREQLLVEPNKSRLHGRGSHSADLQMDSFRSQLRSTEQKKAKLKLHAHALALQRQKVQAELDGAVEGLLHSEELRSAANHADEMDMIAKQEQIVNTIHEIDQQTPLMEQAAALGYPGRGPGPNGEHHSDVLHRQQQMQELHNASMTRRATLADHLQHVDCEMNEIQIEAALLQQRRAAREAQGMAMVTPQALINLPAPAPGTHPLVRGRMDDWAGKSNADMYAELQKMPPHLVPPADARQIGFEMHHPADQLNFYEQLMCAMPATSQATK